jgi:hypothetical protein
MALPNRSALEGKSDTPRQDPAGLAATDIDTARAMAAQKEIGYQTYIKMLLHEALRREGGKQ